MEMSGSDHISPAHSSFPDVLLVCGPSGAGKSTFISAFMQGRLAPELLSALPKAAGAWRQVREDDLRKGRVGPPADGGGNAGVIFHYDTFFVHRIGSPGYLEEPIAAHLLKARNLTVVDIRPGPEQLKKQYDSRIQRRRARGYWSGFGRHTWIRQLKRLRYRLLGLGLPFTRDLYDQAGTIEECYRSWERFLEQVIRSRHATQLLEVAPAEGGSEPSFRLLGARTA
jgi:hypothetical protein